MVSPPPPPLARATMDSWSEMSKRFTLVYHGVSASMGIALAVVRKCVHKNH